MEGEGGGGREREREREREVGEGVMKKGRENKERNIGCRINNDFINSGV